MADNQIKANLRVTEDTVNLIRHAHPKLKRKLRDALQMVLNGTNCGKALKMELKGLRSFRVGKIRIIYSIKEKNTIEIVTIGPRKTIYEATYKLISNENTKK